MVGIISEFGFICVGGGQIGVSVHIRLGVFTGTSVYQGRISKSKVLSKSSYTGESISYNIESVGSVLRGLCSQLYQLPTPSSRRPTLCTPYSWY